ncbi:anthranilate synthase component II [Bernardetia sp.]|uniref:anthranilate synthase component II n=1 Tax=Bernardetia sp. TaxID=1937974 RepID=UPI0025B9514B|nr:aminodeoxychorismate/anthranilate synthase component II [Bernardetia sp.]
MILLLDNFDSFTYNLWDYVQRLGVDCKVFRNDTPLEILKQYDFTGIILSPGFGKPQDAGNMMDVIDFYHQKLPILGVCLGHQALGIYFGDALIYAEKPMHGKVSLINSCVDENKDLIFQNMPSKIEVVRYHSLLIELRKNSPLIPTAFTEKGELMAFSHTTLPIKGIQFHPEAALTKYGLQMLENWLSLTKQKISTTRLENILN